MQEESIVFFCLDLKDTIKATHIVFNIIEETFGQNFRRLLQKTGIEVKMYLKLVFGIWNTLSYDEVLCNSCCAISSCKYSVWWFNQGVETQCVAV